MIERLLDPGKHRSAEYDAATKHILAAEDALSAMLGADGKRALVVLASAYARREELVMSESFADGFCAAVLLAVDVLRH